MVKQIELTQGKHTIVDDIDFDFLNQWNWHANKKKVKTSRDLFYAKRFEKGKTINMHREIIKRVLIEENNDQLLKNFINSPRKFPVDHMDGNGLNNLRNNLRCVSHRENMLNLTKFNGTSKYPGVYWHKEKQKWHVKFKIGNKNHHVGYFSDENEAYDAYVKAVSNLDQIHF